MFDQAYLGNITIFAGNFAPRDWMFCNGSLLAISEFDALFSLIGTIYGGDGQTTFALPNLQSRVAIHAGTLSGNTYIQGEMAGTETITLTQNQMPSHSHPFVSASGNPPASSGGGNQGSPAGNVAAPGSTEFVQSICRWLRTGAGRWHGCYRICRRQSAFFHSEPIPGHELYHRRLWNISDAELMLITNHYKQPI